MPFDLLHIVGWNVLGIAKRFLNCFFRDLSKSVDWAVLMCQEFGPYRSSSLVCDDGHRAFIAPAVSGMRALAIVINSRFLHAVEEDSFLTRGRACSLRMCWGGWKLRLVCAHLSPKNSRGAYDQSLSDLQFVLDASDDDYIVLSVDAQDGVGKAEDDMAGGIVGPYGDEP